MKTTGIILVVFGCLTFIVVLSGKNHYNPSVSIFWIAIGAYLIHVANRKKKEREDKENWNNK